MSNLAQLDAIRYDLDGDGSPTSAALYQSAYPNAADGMGCPSSGCIGYELTANLDFDTNGNGNADAGDAYWNGGAGWDPIGIGEGGYHNRMFGTRFEGNSYIISGLYINYTYTEENSDAVGLFGTLQGAEIGNLGLERVSVSANNSGLFSNTGGLAGSSHNSAITGCYVTGSVAIQGSAGDSGGLVGSNYRIRPNSGSISASYSTASVSVSSQGGNAGGLVGANSSSISTSYSTGSVTSESARSGGLVGFGYNLTLGFQVIASYWDTQTSGQSTSSGGSVGKTTSELQSPTGYTGIYTDWNLDLDGDGTPDDPWNFGTSSQYPTLKNSGTP